MKKTFFTTLFIAITALIFVSSCKKQSLTDDQIQKDIVGTWKGDYNTGDGVGLERSNRFGRAKQTITFTDSSTYSITRNDSTYIVDQTYAIKNGEIHFSYDNSYMDVYHLKGKKLVLKDPDTGDKYRYKKQ